MYIRIFFKWLCIIMATSWLTDSYAFGDSWKKIESRGILRIGFELGNYPLAFYDENHKMVGIDVDMANLLAKRLQVKLEWIPQKRDELMDGLTDHKYDVILSGFSITKNRRKKVLFSDPYYSDNKRIIIPFEYGKKIKTICSLHRKVYLGVQQGTTAYHVGSHIDCGKNKMRFVHYPTNAQAFRDLDQQKIQAIIVDTAYGLYYSSIHLRSYRMFADSLNHAEQKAMAINLTDHQLKNHLNQALKYLRINGDISRIFEKWKYPNLIY